jgi:glycerol-3-phosphate dehydrogenase
VNNSERLTLSFLISAEKSGADICNYVEVKDFIKEGNNLVGVKAVDELTGEEFEISARIMLNAAGPWAYKIIDLCKDDIPQSVDVSNLSLAINLVSKQSIANVAVGVQSKTTKEDDPVCGGKRFMFIVPWGKSTLFGTSYKIFIDDIDSYTVPEKVLKELIDEFVEACPGLNLSLEDISFYHRGFIPIKGNVEDKKTSLLLEQYKIIDHEIVDGILGFVSIIGVKYTTARHVAEKTIDLVFQKLGKKSPQCKTNEVQISGGEILHSDDNEDNFPISEESMRRILHNYGVRYKDILHLVQSNSDDAKPIDKSSSVLRCEILHAIRAEMAVKLSDVVLRRTDLGTTSCPSSNHLKAVANIMASELCWDENRRDREINEVLRTYSPLKTINRLRKEWSNHRN